MTRVQELQLRGAEIDARLATIAAMPDAERSDEISAEVPEDVADGRQLFAKVVGEPPLDD